MSSKGVNFLRKQKFIDNVSLFKCPICGKDMGINETRSLVCTDNHSFDLAKKGYVNLLAGSRKDEYNKEMLEARKQVCDRGFFDPLLERISSLILEAIPGFQPASIKILDAGCGEGTHLAKVLADLQNSGKLPPEEITGIGIDISREGIQIASKNYHHIVWCVADLARIPIKDGKIDIILNILSPSNYKEFKRILARNGLLLKVVPGTDYLGELRSVFYDQTDKEAYSNEQVIKHFSSSFNIINMEQIKYEFAVTREVLEEITRMSPLSWGVPKDRLDKVIASEIKKITVDFTLVLARNST